MKVWFTTAVVVAAGLMAAGCAADRGATAFGYLDRPPEHPASWDDRVGPFVEFVESERGLSFEHPVHVDFLTDEEVRDQVTASDTDLSDEDLDDIESTAGFFRALGLIEGDWDVFESFNQLSGSGTLGYYEFDTQRIVMRGRELTPAVRATLVHELVHALQDQHFGIGATFDELAETDDDSATTAVLRAVVEGDAERIETTYIDSLTEADRSGYEAERQAIADRYDDETADVPPILATLMWLPYGLGESLVEITYDRSGQAGVDELFVEPPGSEEILFDPWRRSDLLAEVPVAAPALADGEVFTDEGPFGATGWYYVLAERIGAQQALFAVDGWGGDRYVGFERDGVTCVRIHWVGDTSADTDEFAVALDAWVRSGPAGHARTWREGSLVGLESCDPGLDSAAVGLGAEEEATLVLFERIGGVSALVDDGMSVESARCIADELLATFTLDELEAVFAEPSPDDADTLRAIGVSCA